MPLVPAVLTLAVALWDIGRPSYWLDEAATVSAVNRTMPDTLRLFDNLDLVHALYYLLMHPWASLFGLGETAMRLPSALAVAAAAAGTAVIGRHCAGPLAGLLAGLVFAVNPEVTRFGQEARSYALVMAVAVAATYLLLRGLRGRGRRAAWSWTAGYGAALAVLVLLNLYAALLVAAHGATLLAMRGRARGAWPRWLAASGIVAAALVPFALAASDQKGQVSWIKGPSGRTLPEILWFFSGGDWWTAVPVTALLLLGGYAGFRALRPEAGGDAPAAPSLGAVAVPWLVLPSAVLLTVSLFDPVFLHRYVAYSLPAAALLVGAGLAWTARRTVRGARTVGAVAAAVALVVLVATAVPQHREVRRQDSRPDDLRAAADVLRANARPGDAMMYMAGIVRWSAAAYPSAFSDLPDVALATDAPRAGNLKGRDLLPREMRGRLAAAGRVWVMTSRMVEYPRPPILERRLEFMHEMGFRKQAGRWRFRGGELVLFERVAPTRAASKTKAKSKAKGNAKVRKARCSRSGRPLPGTSARECSSRRSARP
ncbi:glycosyltransferase family 39 protein [Spirillospora sp. CA-253888]